MNNKVPIKKYYKLKSRIQDLEEHIELGLHNNNFVLSKKINYYGFPNFKYIQGNKGPIGHMGPKGKPGTNANMINLIGGNIYKIKY